jgi:flagellar motility protein MotE (MotC chaperone)
VAQILLQMRGRQAAQIMSSLDTDKAAEISKMLISKDGVKKLSRPEAARAAR